MKNKMKIMFLSALSLCLISAGATAITASANEMNTEIPELEISFVGASVRYNAEDGKNGIRFAISMEKDAFEYYQTSIVKSYTVISMGETTSKEIETTNNWYGADEKGQFTTTNIDHYQTTVYMYGIPTEHYTTNFTARGFLVMEDETIVSSPAGGERSMQYVAKEAVKEDSSLQQALSDYLPNCTVTIDVDGEISTQEVKFGTSANLLNEIEVPEKEGYTFDGWKALYNGEYVEIDGAMVTEDVTIKAIYSAKQYKLTVGETELSVTYGKAIGTLPALSVGAYEEAYWTIDGEKISAETIWNYTENKTATEKRVTPLVIGFENGESYTVTGATAYALSAAFNVNEKATAYGDKWYTNYAYAGKNSLRVHVANQTATVKIKVSDLQAAILSAGGTVNVYARSVYGHNPATVTINGKAVNTSYLWTMADYGLIELGKLAIDSNGYITLSIASNVQATHVIIDNITIVPPADYNPLLVNFEGTVKYSVSGASNVAVGKASIQPSSEAPGAIATWWVTVKHNGSKALTFNVGENATATVKVKLTATQLEALAESKTIKLLAAGLMGTSNGSVFTVEGQTINGNYGAFPAWSEVTLTNVTADADGYISFKVHATKTHSFFAIDDICIVTP